MVSVKHNGIEMSLDVDEAQALVDVLGHVGGPPKSRRRFIEDILQALTTNGFTHTSFPDDMSDGEIRFK